MAECLLRTRSCHCALGGWEFIPSSFLKTIDGNSEIIKKFGCI